MKTCTGATGRGVAVSFLFTLAIAFSLQMSAAGSVAQAEEQKNFEYQNLKIENDTLSLASCEAKSDTKGEGHPPRRCPLRHN